MWQLPLLAALYAYINNKRSIASKKYLIQIATMKLQAIPIGSSIAITDKECLYVAPF